MLKIIEEEKRNILISDDGKMLEEQNNKELLLEEGLEPFKTDKVYVPKTISLETLKKKWKEINIIRGE